MLLPGNETVIYGNVINGHFCLKFRNQNSIINSQKNNSYENNLNVLIKKQKRDKKKNVVFETLLEARTKFKTPFARRRLQYRNNNQKDF